MCVKGVGKGIIIHVSNDRNLGSKLTSLFLIVQWHRLHQYTEYTEQASLLG